MIEIVTVDEESNDGTIEIDKECKVDKMLYNPLRTDEKIIRIKP